MVPIFDLRRIDLLGFNSPKNTIFHIEINVRSTTIPGYNNKYFFFAQLKRLLEINQGVNHWIGGTQDY